MELPQLHVDTANPQLQRTFHTIAVSSHVETQRKPFFDGIFDSPKRRSTGSLPKPKLASVDKTPLMSTDDFLRGSQITEDFQIESRSSQNTDYNYYPTSGVGESDDTTRLNDYPPSQHSDSKETKSRPTSDIAAPHHSHRRVSSSQTYASTPRTPTARLSSSGRSLPLYSSSSPSPHQQRQSVQSVRSSYLTSSNRLSSQKLAYSGGTINVMVPSGLPNMVVKVERDYTLGDGITQFEKTFPLELQGRVAPDQFDRTITTINDMLRNAERLSYNCFDNLMECLTIYTWSLCCTTHYQRSVQKIIQYIEAENKRVYNQEGLQIASPIKCAWLYLEFEMV